MTMTRRLPTSLASKIPLLGAALAFLATGCGATRPPVPRPAQALSPAELAGTWHVLESTFPMWLEGKKTDPTFTYDLIAGDERRRMNDLVSYRKEGEPDSIAGVDTPDPEDASHFTWRGKGLLFLFKSEWYVVMRAPDRSWAVIYFSSTIATPEGMDIIARTAALPAETLVEIRAAIEADPTLRRKLAELKAVRHERAPP
jgi:lipocalin